MREYYFGKQLRLLKTEDYLNLRKFSKKVENSDFFLIFKINKFEYSRIGLTVSKRVGNAVVRNRIKRIIREYFRYNRDILKENIDINVIAKKYTAGKTNKEIFKSLEDVFLKLTIG